MKDVYQNAVDFLKTHGLIEPQCNKFYIQNEKGDTFDLCGLMRDFTYQQNQRFIFGRNVGEKSTFLKSYNLSEEKFGVLETENQKEAIMCASLEEAEDIKQNYLCYLTPLEFHIVGINLDDLF